MATMTPPARPAPAPPGQRASAWVTRNFWVWSLAASLALWLLADALTGTFSVKLLLVNASLATFLALAGVAQMIVITSGDGSFDLSLPYVITISAMLSAGVLGHAHSNAVFGIVLALAAGTLIGCVNGALTSLLKMPAMVASLSVGYVVYSAILVLENLHFTGVSAAVSNFLRAETDGAAVVLGVTAVIAVLVAVLLAATVYGRNLHAMGQSRPAAQLSGIRVNRMIIYNFALAGLLGAVVGVLLAAYDGGAFQNIGDVYLLGSVAAVVVGGVPVTGGRSSVPATMLGALVMTLLVTVLEVSKLDAGVQDILEGVAVILIVVLAQLGRTRQSR
jgi:ribose transport system permease protein